MSAGSRVVNYRRRAKMKLIVYKGGKCEMCSYCKPCPSAYSFHHRDPGKKDFTIGGKSFSFKRLCKEADKCDLLCVRCHTEVHDAEVADSREKGHAEYMERRISRSKACAQCKRAFWPKTLTQKYCSSGCCHRSQRVVERPRKQHLARMIGKKSWVALGRKYGVSDNAVRKWARGYRLI